MPQLQTSPALYICILISVSILLSRLSICWVIGIGLLLPIPVPLLLPLRFRGILWVHLILHLLWLGGLHHGVPVATCWIVRISVRGHRTGSGYRLRNCILGMGILIICGVHMCSVRKCGIRKCCIRIRTLYSLSIMEVYGVL